jgi:Winged helix DNA-binding domain
MPKKKAAKQAAAKSAVNETAARKPAAKTAAARPAAKKAAAKKAAAKKAAAKIAGKPVAAKKAAAKKAAAKPAAAKKAAAKIAGKPVAAKKAATKKAATKKAATKKAAGKKAVAKPAAKPAAAKKAAAKPAAAKAAEKPVAKKPAARRAAKTAGKPAENRGASAGLAPAAPKPAAPAAPAARKAASAQLEVTLEQARAFWCAKQGLSPHVDGPVTSVVERTGWVRTLGGVDVYLAVRARSPGMRRQDLDAAVTRGELHVLPAARGCIYLVPESDRALALSFAASLARPRAERDLEKVGMSWGELEELSQLVLAALGTSPMTTNALRKALPEGAVRSLGDAGKKLGMSSPLPAVLRELEFDGHIERMLEDGRLDTERYVWRVAPAARRDQILAVSEDPAARLAGVVRRFLEVSGPVSIKELAAWSGAGQRECKAAVETLEAVPVSIAGRSDPAWVLDGDIDALAAACPPDDPGFAFLSVGDNLAVVYGGPAVFVDPTHHDRPVESWSNGPRTVPLGEARYLGHRMLLLGNRIVGFWEYDPVDGEIMCRTLDPLPPELGKRLIDESESAAAFLRDDVGHGRSFSLDTDEALHQRAQALRADALRAQADRDR